MRSHYDTSDPAEWKASPARPDAATLRERIEAALQDSTDSCARCKVCDRQIAAVMAVLAEHGLVEREKQGNG